MGIVKNRISGILGARRETIQSFARGAGISRAAATGLFHEKSKRLDFATLDKVCRYLKVDIGGVLYLEPPLDEEVE